VKKKNRYEGGPEGRRRRRKRKCARTRMGGSQRCLSPGLEMLVGRSISQGYSTLTLFERELRLRQRRNPSFSHYFDFTSSIEGICEVAFKGVLQRLSPRLTAVTYRHVTSVITIAADSLLLFRTLRALYIAHRYISFDCSYRISSHGLLFSCCRY
jgi:hypothetical protein